MVHGRQSSDNSPAGGDRPVFVVFLWHMHQPEYRDPSTGRPQMPWVRLHCTKDYYRMAKMVDSYPEIRVAFSLVPCLLDQIEDLSQGGAPDSLFDLSYKPADSLSTHDKERILVSFFEANVHSMIEPFPRYRELFIRGGQHRSTMNRRRALTRFTTQDWLDLQVWFNIAWCDPVLRESSELERLIKKGRGFTEDDKAAVLRCQEETVRQTIPTYRELFTCGHIEIASCPAYHPILPLLVDTSVATDARPHAQLPTRGFSYPEDAELQVSRAVHSHEGRFGSPPKGLWMPECGVSTDALRLAAASGFTWTIIPEDVMGATLGTTLRHPDTEDVLHPDLLYRPVNFAHGDHQISLLVRDKQLSDRIQFSYMRLPAEEAVDDLVGSLLAVRDQIAHLPHPPVVCIALDGENCWEYYTGNGQEFLTTLYDRLSREPLIRTTLPSEYLEDYPARRTISSVRPGSWIDNSFDVWIGEEECNRAWTYLAEARMAVEQFLSIAAAKQMPKTELEKIRRHMLIAEGSDWWWWYSPRHWTIYCSEFDRLFRSNLIHVYDSLSLDVPPNLYIPSSRVRYPAL